jgi:hypothetical protein
MLFGYDRHLYTKYIISDSIHDRSVFNTAQEHEIFGEIDFPSWLTQQQISLACTTYQTSRLMLIGAAPETNIISAFWRQFYRAIRLFCTPSRIYLSSKYQLGQLDNVLAAGQLHQGDDRLYIPRLAHTTCSLCGCFGLFGGLFGWGDRDLESMGAIARFERCCFWRSNLGRFVAVAGRSRFVGADRIVLFAV